MSQVPNNSTEKHFDILKIVALALGLGGMLILPIGLYLIGQLISVHVALSDLNSGFSQSAFYQIVYNATHVSSYQQLAELNQGESINIASQDQSTIALIMLGFGLIADIPLALKLREWVRDL